MNLPFTQAQFLAVFKTYNQAVFPAQFLLMALAIAVIIMVFSKKTWENRVIPAILSILWIWMGAVYHIMFFSSINPAAMIFGAAFILQGILFAVFGTVKMKLAFEPKRDVRTIAGLAVILYGLAIYPLLGLLLGHAYPASPTFGAPCPTTIFTFGILLLAKRPFPRYLLIIPGLWAVVGFMAAVKLGVLEDVGLLAAGIVCLGFHLAGRKGRTEKAVEA